MADNELARRFLLPEKEVSLKVVFDNLRNYAIIGVIVAMAQWFQSGRATAPTLIFKKATRANWDFEVWTCLAVAAVLFVLNLWQSYHVVIGLTTFGDAESGPSTGERAKRPWHTRIFIWVLVLCLFAVFMAIMVSLFNLVVFIAWFAAVGNAR